MSRWILLAFLLVIGLQISAAQGPAHCCSKATGSCRFACDEMQLTAVADSPEELRTRMEPIHKLCPQNTVLLPFWECMNETIQDVMRGVDWSGRFCCSQAWTEPCRASCVRARSRDDLKSVCRESDEIDFFGCLSHQELGDNCCSSAHTAACRIACAAVFRTLRTPSREVREAVREECAESSPRVYQCVRNHIKPSPAINTDKYLHCCDWSESTTCRNSCQKAMRTMTTDHEIVDTLRDGGCGNPMESDMVWSCLMQNGKTPRDRLSSGTSHSGEASRIDRTGIDSAKLFCCNQAKNQNCQRLCKLSYSNNWNHSIEFYNICLLNNNDEENLTRCFLDVEEPCELGCDGLSFCSNLNHRPTQLFRSCSRQVDEAAHLDVVLRTQQGFVKMLGLQLPMLNVSKCNTDIWKTVSCIMHTRPCHPETHTSNICYEDCLDLLFECVGELPEGHSAESLCRRISPRGPCISLQEFMQPNPYWLDATIDLQVTSPCRGDPCNSSQVCVINRNCQAGKSCSKYSCVDGCKVGDVSKYVLPQGTYMRLPIEKNGKSCFKSCQCSAKGTAVGCSTMQCSNYESCMYGSHKINHGHTFQVDCNVCTCHSGEITCSKRHCPPTSMAATFSSLPCNCPAHHMPVCGRNGNNYPSACLAKCTGLMDSDIKLGPCSSQDPCQHNPCGENLHCVPTRQVCLSVVNSNCRQYECVDARTSCKAKPHEPVCDTDNQEHPNLCFLVQYKRRFAYKGPCLTNCKWTGLVCGTDGQSHLSECAALAARVPVDYDGPCLAVGLALPTAGPQCGPAVQCRPLPIEGCAAVTPPGACCPVCGGAVRMLVSQKQADRAAIAMRKTKNFSVADVLTALERHVQTAECRLLGHLTIEADLFVLVQPISPTPSALQLDACVAEAHKLATQVLSASPRLVSELALSVLTGSAVMHGPAEMAAASALLVPVGLLMPLMAALLIL